MAFSSAAKYRSTKIAFDDLIVQVGKAIAKAQQEMDAAHLDFQRQVAREVKERGLERLDVNAGNAYTIPETKLSLRIGLSLKMPEGGGEPTLEAVPVNAGSTGEGEVDVSTTTEIDLRFVSVPKSQEPPGPPASRLSPSEVQVLLGQSWLAAARPEGGATRLEELSDERLWVATTLVAREPGMVVVIDDRRGEVLLGLAEDQRPSADALAPVGAPVLGAVSPEQGVRGQILELVGDDLLTLAGQTSLELDGRPIPILRHGMRSLAFKVPPWATRGDLKVTTPLGSTISEGAFIPLPSISDFEPREGWFDSLRQRGTWLTVVGSNFRPGCSIRFATGAEAKRVEIVSESRLQVEVPEAADSGPLTLTVAGHEHTQTSVEPFVMLPRIDRVQPRQAPVGALLTLTGNHLVGIGELLVGQARVDAGEFELHTPTQIRVRVPSGATDGPLVARVTGAGGEPVEVRTRDLFYVVPHIVGFAQTVVVPGQLLTIQAEGLDPEPEMLTLLFDARGGISEAPVLAVASDRRSLTTRVPADAVTGYLLLLRKRIYSGRSPDDTSHTSDNKLTVLTDQGAAVDVLIDERFSADTLEGWTAESGEWSVVSEQLACAGTGRLAIDGFEARRAVVLHGEVLQAERFGVSLLTAGSDARLQLWVQLSDGGSSLSWSTLDDRNRQELLGSAELAQMPGGSQLFSLRVRPDPDAPETSLRLAVAIDQVEVDVQVLERGDVTGLALLSDDDEQRWDNVVVLSRDVLSLPEPGAYRFAAVPAGDALDLPRIDSFSPGSGAPGVSVEVLGDHLDEVVQVFVGGAEAGVESIAVDRLTFSVPEGAATGPLELHGRGGVVVASAERFLLPPILTNVEPRTVLPGELLRVIGRNLPTELGEFTVTVLGEAAEVVAASPAMISVLTPEVSGEGVVEIAYAGHEVTNQDLVEVRQRMLLLDLLSTAGAAVWATADGELVFGPTGGSGQGSVRLVNEAVLEDGESYGPALLLEPPRASTGALRGVFPELELGVGARLLTLTLGVSSGEWGTSASIQIDWLDSSDPTTPHSVLPATSISMDGGLENFVLSLPGSDVRVGRLVISVKRDQNTASSILAITLGEVSLEHQ